MKIWCMWSGWLVSLYTCHFLMSLISFRVPSGLYLLTNSTDVLYFLCGRGVGIALLLICWCWLWLVAESTEWVSVWSATRRGMEAVSCILLLLCWFSCMCVCFCASSQVLKHIDWVSFNNSITFCLVLDSYNVMHHFDIRFILCAFHFLDTLCQLEMWKTTLSKSTGHNTKKSNTNKK